MKLSVPACLGLATGAMVALLARSGLWSGRECVRAAGICSEGVLPLEAPFHDQLEDLAAKLERGTADIGSILELTLILLSCVEPGTPQGIEGLKAFLSWESHRFGRIVSLPQSVDGSSNWELEVIMPSLGRYQHLADETTIQFFYSARAETLIGVSASTQTHIHRSAETKASIGATPFVVGGNIVVKQGSCTWQAETIRFESSSGVARWVSALSSRESRSGNLGSQDSAIVCAMLSAL